MTDSPREMLERGVTILAPALEPHGFLYTPVCAGRSSGGTFASGNFTRDDRHLSLHHRFGLGVVTFGNDLLTTSHENYISFLGVAHRSKLLWTPLTSGLDRYEALRFDIETLCEDFTTGDASLLIAAAKDYTERMRMEGVHRNANAVGDLEKRRLEHDAFKCNRYADAIELIGSLAYPELLTGSETRMVEISRTRSAGTKPADVLGRRSPGS